MNKISIGNHLTPYLLFACILFAGILAWQSRNLIQAQNNTLSETRTAVDRVTRENFTSPDLVAFSEINERPLFAQGREPPSEPLAASRAIARLPPLRLQLEGVAITPAASIAVVRDLSNNKMLHLSTGMEHQGWELTSISNTVATFTRGEKSQEITLKID